MEFSFGYGYGMWILGYDFRVWDVSFRVWIQGMGCGFQGMDLGYGMWILGYDFRVWDVNFRVWVQGMGCGFQGMEGLGYGSFQGMTSRVWIWIEVGYGLGYVARVWKKNQGMTFGYVQKKFRYDVWA